MPLPKPKPFERQADFINRCIPQVIEEDKAEREQATAICYGIWNKK